MVTTTIIGLTLLLKYAGYIYIQAQDARLNEVLEERKSTQREETIEARIIEERERYVRTMPFRSR